MGVRKGTSVQMPILLLQGQTENAHGQAHGEDAQGDRFHSCEERYEGADDKGRTQ